MFNVDTSTMICIAKLFDFFRVDEFRVDDTILALTPLEEFKVFFILCRIMKVYLVFFYLLAGEIVTIEIAEAIFWP